MSLLYYLGIMQKVVYVFALVLGKLCKLSGAESLSAAANIFVGQTEAPLLIKPYVEKMTKSELMCVMTGGMATGMISCILPVVCLGAGLSATGDAPLVTTLDQCWRRDPIPAEALARGVVDTPATLVHGAFRYTVPRQPATLRLSLDAREGSWSRVSAAEKKRVSGEVFTLWLDHGPAPKAATYAYVVSPAALPAPKVEILSNTPDLQAARDAAGRVAVVAHRAGDFSFGGCTLATEPPCVALFTKEGGLTFVDPATGRDDFRCVLTCP